MSKANLKAFKVTKIDFKNDIKEQKKIELGFGYSYNVKYSNQNTCVGEFSVKVTDKSNPDEFSIQITALGIFTFEAGTQKEILHVETYNDLFPYVRSFLTTITANGGIPPIIMPFIDISKKEIYRFEMGKNGQNANPDDFINPFDSKK